ncbi:late sexual development protein [Paramyrothecium foliicola]|nr:late sexual development protein [Paramyrothecium foliicola]
MWSTVPQLASMGLLKSFAAATFVCAVSSRNIPRSFGIPSANGFPAPDEQQALSIANQAGGRTPNSPLPNTLPADSATAFQLITANELFETAFFSNLLNNITTGVQGYEGDDQIVEILNTVLAQEQSHALAARAVLATAGAFVPEPCQYQVPVTTLKDAIFFIETVTAAVLGALQGANTILAKDGVTPLVQVISSVIGQEGEQNGFYRYKLDRVPSESPFLTYVPAPFAWSALQTLTVPGSCPYPASEISLPVFSPLSANGGHIALLEPKDQTISFSADLSSSEMAKPYVGGDGKGLYVTYTTGQLIPISEPVGDVSWEGNVISFNASFKSSTDVIQGFSHAALTTANGFATGDEVVGATLAAPALLQVARPL